MRIVSSAGPMCVCVCVYSFVSQVQESQAIQPRAKRKVMVLMLPSIPRITLPGSILNQCPLYTLERAAVLAPKLPLA